MKSPSWPFLILLALILGGATVGSIAWKLGAFRDVSIQTRNDGPFVTLSKEHLGAYHKIADVILEIETWARANGEPCIRTFGEFLDDPERTDEDRLRSRAGCLLSKANSEEVEKLKAKLPQGYSLGTIGERLYTVATFDGAPSLGPVKVYPSVFEFLELNRLTLDGPVIEIYEIQSDNVGTTRLFPVSPITVK